MFRSCRVRLLWLKIVSVEVESRPRSTLRLHLCASINVCTHYIDDLFPYEPLSMQLLGKWSSLIIVTVYYTCVLAVVCIDVMIASCSCSLGVVCNRTPDVCTNIDAQFVYLIGTPSTRSTFIKSIYSFHFPMFSFIKDGINVQSKRQTVFNAAAKICSIWVQFFTWYISLWL